MEKKYWQQVLKNINDWFNTTSESIYENWQ